LGNQALKELITELNSLRLRFGDMLQLQLPEVAERFHVRLIGYLESRSIIITLPVKNQRAVPIRSGQKLNIRMMVNDQACAFVTEVLQIFKSPYPHAHLKYPSDLVTNNIRKAARVDVRVDGVVINQSIGERAKEVECYLADISETGAHLVTPLRIGKTGDEIRLNLELMIGKIPRTLIVDAILRGRLKARSKEKERAIHYGVEFINLIDNHKIDLIAFVYSKLAS
jgi:c-di-GMP-binding flagellar brake protein YcgR